MPYYIRNTGKSWTPKDVASLKQMVKQNTPTRVAGLKLGRTEDSIRAEASKLNLSLKPTNQSPYTRKS